MLEISIINPTTVVIIAIVNNNNNNNRNNNNNNNLLKPLEIDEIEYIKAYIRQCR